MQFLYSQVAVQIESLNIFSSMVRLNFARCLHGISKIGWHFWTLSADSSPVYPINKRPPATTADAAARSMMKRLLAVAAAAALVSGSMVKPARTRMWVILVAMVVVLFCACTTLRTDIAIRSTRGCTSRGGNCTCDCAKLTLAFASSMTKKGAFVSCWRFACTEDSWPNPEMVDDSTSTALAALIGSR